MRTDGRGQDRRADGLRVQHRRDSRRCATGRGDGAGRVRRARRAGLPAHRRPAGDMGEPGGDRQAGAFRSAGQEEVAARGGRPHGRHARRGRARQAAAPRGRAQRGRPGPRGRPGGGGRRQGLDRREGRGPAGGRPHLPGGDPHARRRAGRVRRDRRVHHRTAVVRSKEPMTITHPRPPGEAATRHAAAEALGRARDHLLGLQTAEQAQAAARWIASKQRDDGTWANFYGGPGDLSTTVEAYVALRLAGHEPQAAYMDRAAEWIRDRGGIPATRVFTRIWLALFGQWSWDDLPVMPPELIYLPAWFPFNIYDWGCWARQTIVPLTVVGSFRPATPLPFGLKELWPEGDPSTIAAGRRDRPRDPRWAAAFGGLDRVLHRYERHAHRAAPVRAVRHAAIRRCLEWIIARQEADGCWG